MMRCKESVHSRKGGKGKEAHEAGNTASNHGGSSLGLGPSGEWERTTILEVRPKKKPYFSQLLLLGKQLAGTTLITADHRLKKVVHRNAILWPTVLWDGSVIMWLAIRGFGR